MSPEMLQIVPVVGSVITAFLGYLVWVQRKRIKAIESESDAKHDKHKIDMAEIKQEASVAKANSDNNAAMIALTRNLVENIGKMDSAHRIDASNIEIAIQKNGKKLDDLDDTIGTTTNNTIAHISGLSKNIVKVLEQLGEISQSVINNKSQHDKIAALIVEFEGLVSKLNIITDAKEKTQPLPDLSDILSESTATADNVNIKKDNE